ncbi:MAG: hypothetical protein JWR18_3538 [Segetibacter sp.]|nr:hypothetical protein [Segetibacter sp.]
MIEDTNNQTLKQSSISTLSAGDTGVESNGAKGILIVIAGKEINRGKSVKNDVDRIGCSKEALKTFIDLIEKKDPVIEIITSSSNAGNDLFEDYKKAFLELEVTNLRHIHHTSSEECDNEDSVSSVQSADAFFFADGDQLLLTSIYSESAFLRDLKARYIKEKIVIGATGGSAMALSGIVISGESNQVQELPREINVAKGLAFLENVCLDTLFVNPGILIRLAQVIAKNPDYLALKISEHAAIIVRNGHKVEVVGTGTLIVLDGQEISEAKVDEPGKPVTIRDLKVHILSPGQTFILPRF